MTSPDKPKIDNIRMVALLFYTLIPCVAIWIGLYHLQSAFITFILYHGICLTPAILWGQKHWKPTFTKPAWKDVGLIFLASVIVCALAVLAYELIGQKLLSNENALALLDRFSSSNRAMLVFLNVFIVIANPLLEELFWRGVVFNELETWQTKFKHFGLVWSSCSYALYHYLIFRLVMFPVFAEIAIVMLAFYGASLAMVYRKTGSIITTAIAHGMMTDMAVVALIVDLLRHHPEFMR